MIGGGRWARVITRVLCEILPSSVSVSLHSLHNSEGVLKWTNSQNLRERIHVFPDWPKFVIGDSCAIIVANSARDHYKSVKWALSQRIPVLVEKPVALTAKESEELADIASQNNSLLAAAHVFLFTRYIENFSKYLANAGALLSLRIEWTDPEIESRYGEPKYYDPSIPVFIDCLPHIVSILTIITREIPRDCEISKFMNGGACLELKMKLGDIGCSILLERNSDRRRRHIFALAGNRKIQLDFSMEPGFIMDGAETINADPDWCIKSRPVAHMLSIFLRWAAGGEFDPRLDVRTGIRACYLSDTILDKYRSAMKT